MGATAADFNGDGYLDLAVANNPGSNISVLINDGDGTFATQVFYATNPSQYPYNVTAGDMDKDGNVDIVTGGSMGFVIFYGNGDGTFAAADNHYFVETVQDVVVADFNNDTYLDIATSHAVRDSVGIHINNHDSTYTTHLVPTGQGTISLSAAHLDGDSYIDLLVGCNKGVVWNLKNDQSGSFTGTEVHLGILDDPARIDVTDLDGDNIGDFVVIHAVNDFLFPYFNNGDGTYTVGSGHVTTDNPIAVRFADVNGDSNEDILVGYGTSDSVELYLNLGSNTFSRDSAYDVGGTPKDIVYADLDNDGYKDMAVTAYNGDKIEVFLSRLSLIVSVDDVTTGAVPDKYSLEQNYPNPFNPETHIRFALPKSSYVKVEVFNMLGRSVAVLVDDYLEAGIKEVTWNGVNNSGRKVASGIYMYRVTTDQFTDSKTMLLLK